VNEPRFLLDTGPLVACFDPRDEHFAWAAEIISQTAAPLVTCEPVLTESFHLLSKTHNGADLLASFCQSGAVQTPFPLLDHMKALHELMRKYRNIPMSLADACLVLLAEKHESASVITTDSDFLIYRTPARRKIRLIAPFP
jgi:uncharacterized protein